MDRRTFIMGALSTLGLLAGGFYFAKGSLYRQAVNGVRSLSGEVEARFLRQLITSDAAHSRTIMWQSDSPLTNAGVKYRLAGQEDIRMTAAREDFFTDDGVENNQYLVNLQKLEADTDYEYRVVAEGATGEWHSLRTAGAGDFECLIFPDSQSSDYSDW